MAECWREDGICAVGHKWTFEEEWGDEPCTNRFRLFQKAISKGDIILATCGKMIAYVGEVADNTLRDERKNTTGDRYKYWNQRKVTWWTEPNHFHREDLPPWMRKQFPKRGQTIKEFDLKSLKGSDLIVSKRVAVLKIEPELQNDFCLEKIPIGTDAFTVHVASGRWCVALGLN